MDYYENFGGGCDCAGSSSCYAYQNGTSGRQLQRVVLRRQLDLRLQRRVPPATNNVAWYWGELPGGIMSPNVRGMGISTGMFGNWGSPDNC